MPDEPTPEPDPAVEGEVVDDIALQPDAPPRTTSAATRVAPADTGYTSSGVPTFESVREDRDPLRHGHRRR